MREIIDKIGQFKLIVQFNNSLKKTACTAKSFSGLGLVGSLSPSNFHVMTQTCFTSFSYLSVVSVYISVTSFILLSLYLV